MTATQRLSLPHILPGQAQKELFHNEALQILDVLVAGAVEEPPRDSPPASPTAGSCYIVGSAPTGDWAGKANQVAAYTAGGWRYLVPVEGMELHVRSSSVTAAYRGGAWEMGVVRGSNLTIGGQQVVGPRATAILDPVGGTKVDAEARAAISAVLAALRQHGLVQS
jgi:YHS domain-containing protein